MIPFVERMDYLSYFFNMQAFCGAVEKLLELEIPPRAKYLRTIHLELNRIHSHLIWLGTTALDLGAVSMLWYALRERDTIVDLFEMATGQRMHTRYFQVGGVFEDIPVGFERKLREFCAEMPNRINQYEALLDRNEIFLQRTKGVGIVSRERLLELGVTGPLLRASGEPWDLRKADPYLAYGDVEFKIPVGTVGDGYDRYRCRMQEMRESVRIIEQCLDGLPEGPWIADDRKVVLPPRDELSTSMEALIHHFKLVTEGFRVPPGEVYYPIEGPRGELGCYVLADGSAKPARVHFRDPSFVNLQMLRDMCVGGYIADLIQNLGDAGSDPGRRRPLMDARVSASPAPARSRPTSSRPRSGGELIASMRPSDAEGVPELHEVDIPDELREQIEESMSRYPQLRSASIPALWAVQRHYGWCSPDGIRQAAAVMGVTPAYLESVASFYDLFATSPVGRHRVLVCHNISCWMQRRRRPARGVLRGDRRRPPRRRPPRRELARRRVLRQGLRVPRGLRHRADGVDRRALLRPAHRRRRARRDRGGPRRGRAAAGEGDLPAPGRRRAGAGPDPRVAADPAAPGGEAEEAGGT